MLQLSGFRHRAAGYDNPERVNIGFGGKESGKLYYVEIEICV